jgi:hypothetical protein
MARHRPGQGLARAILCRVHRPARGGRGRRWPCATRENRQTYRARRKAHFPRRPAHAVVWRLLHRFYSDTLHVRTAAGGAHVLEQLVDVVCTRARAGIDAPAAGDQSTERWLEDALGRRNGEAGAVSLHHLPGRFCQLSGAVAVSVERGDRCNANASGATGPSAATPNALTPRPLAATNGGGPHHVADRVGVDVAPARHHIPRPLRRCARDAPGGMQRSV